MVRNCKKEGRNIPQPHGKEILKVFYENAFTTPNSEKTGV